MLFHLSITFSLCKPDSQYKAEYSPDCLNREFYERFLTEMWAGSRRQRMTGTQRSATEETTDTLSLTKQGGKQYDGCSVRAGGTEEGSYSWRSGTQAGTQQGGNTPNRCSCCCFPLVESQLLLQSVRSANWGTSRAKDTE